MKFIYLLFAIYQWIIAIPLFVVSTIITSILTLILSPILPNSKISYLPAIIWGKFCCYVFFINVRINGLEHLDRKQSYVFTANHQSVFDIFSVYGWLPFIFKWLMKMELRKVPFIGFACQTAGHIFIDRSNPIAAKQSMDKAAEQLKNGNSVVIFPEGTRTKNGQLGRFKRGAFNLAAELGLPIVPMTISGSFDRIRSFRIKPGTITLTIHPPILSSEISSKTTNEIMSKTWDIINSKLQQVK